MIKYDDKGKLQVHLLSAKRILPDRIIKEYDHKKVMKDMKNIMETLIDNYFYQVAYQEFLNYDVDDNLEMVIVEDPNFKCRVLTDNYEADDTSFKYFKKSDYRKSIDLCELLLRRVKDSYNKLEEMERFIFYNNEISDEKEYTDESLCFEAGINKDKYYGIKKSAYIKIANINADYSFLDEIVDNMIKQNKDERYKDIETIQYEIKVRQELHNKKNEINKLKEIKFSESKENDILILDPPKLIDVSNENESRLRFKLSQPVNGLWVESIKSNGWGSVMGYDVDGFRFEYEYASVSLSVNSLNSA